jgi:hypothetical protein
MLSQSLNKLATPPKKKKKKKKKLLCKSFQAKCTSYHPPLLLPFGGLACFVAC